MEPEMTPPPTPIIDPIPVPVMITLQPRSQFTIFLLSFLFFACLALTGFLYWQNTSLKSQLTAAPSPTPVASVDPTSSWKTYTNTEFGFEFQYPGQIEEIDVEGSVIFAGKKYKTKQVTAQNSDSNISVRIVYDWNKPEVDPYEISDYSNSIKHSGWFTAYTENTVNEPGCYKSYAQSLTANQKNTIEISVSEPCPSDVTTKQSQVELDQILSTFKFTETKATSNLLSGWTYFNDSACDISIPTPPKKIDNDARSWTIESNAGYDLLGFFTGNSTTIIHRNPTEASGYISGFVSIICGEQKNRSLDKINSDFHSHLTAQNSGNTSPEALIELTSNKDTTLWELPTKEMTFVGGMFDPTQKYYLTLSAGKWYIITKKYESSNPEIKQQADQIFNLLKFSDQ